MDQAIRHASRLEECESIIARGLTSFVEVGRALTEIRDQRLYRAHAETFEGYCRERWGFSRQRAHQLIDSARVIDVVSTIVDVAPENEAQARALAELPAEQQPAVWAKAVETAPRNDAGEPVVSAAHVRRVAMESARPATREPAASPLPPGHLTQFRLGLMLRQTEDWVSEIVSEEPKARLALAEQFERMARQLREESTNA